MASSPLFSDEDPLNLMQQWKRDIYYIQLQAPQPRKVECHIDIPTRPECYGTEFHGEISRHETDDLLIQDGCYLVRESQRNPGCYTLAIRFNNATKNYKLYYDTTLNQHYVGDKYFDHLEELVADGLICFHVNLKAPDYIASMNNGEVDSHYEESPYMKYRQEMVSRQEMPGQLYDRSHSPTPPMRPSHHSLTAAGGSFSRHSRPVSTANGNFRPNARPITKSRSVMHSHHGPPIPTSAPIKPSPGDGTDAPRFSSGQRASDWMDIMKQEKAHNFKVTMKLNPANSWCDYCLHFMFGLIKQGMECQDCGIKAHKKCSEKLPCDCMPTMKKLKRTFGLDLTTLLKATNRSIPFVVEKCVNELEGRGLHHEGLYRVAGFHDDIEAIRKSFDFDGDTDITEKSYEDIATITSVLKLFFRQLPLPLITFEVYPKLTAARNVVADLKSSLIQLPTAHFQTLKYLICHLNKVDQLKDRNMMSAENLSIVFAPTMLQSPQSDPIAAMSIGKIEARAIEALILNYSSVFDG